MDTRNGGLHTPKNRETVGDGVDRKGLGTGVDRAHVQVLRERLAEVSPFLFGADIEHHGRIVYGGVWDAERDIPRADVQAAVRALAPTMLRYPGSSFASGYHWRDGIGPKESRPRYETTWWSEMAQTTAAMRGISGPEVDALAAQMGPPEPNLFGTHEFLQYCLDTGAEPLLSANLGGGTPTGEGTPEEAADWVRYCNVDRHAPRPVQWWQVGNEVYGSFEWGHCSPADYGKRFAEFSRHMRSVDPSIKIVAVGAGLRSVDFPGDIGDHLPDIDRWNAEVLGAAGDEVDALSINWYFPGGIGRDFQDDEPDYLQIVTGGDEMGAMLDRVMAQADAVVGADRRLPLAVTEWNRQVNVPDDYHADNHRLCDGLFYAGCFNRMLERGDRVQLALLSQLVNTMAPIQVEGDRHFVTAFYLVAMLYRHTFRRSALAVEVDCGRLTVPPLATNDAPFVLETCRSTREAPVVDAVATVDDRGATVFLANRSLDREIEVTVEGLSFDGPGVYRCLTGSGPFARNTVDAPNELRFAERGVDVAGGRCTIVLPPTTAGALVVGAGIGA